MLGSSVRRQNSRPVERGCKTPTKSSLTRSAVKSDARIDFAHDSFAVCVAFAFRSFVVTGDSPLWEDQ